MQTSPGITTPHPPTSTKSKTATDNKQIKVILGDSLNDGDKKNDGDNNKNNGDNKKNGDINEDSNRKQTVLNIDQYLLSLSTTLTPTTAHPSDGFDVGDHTHDEIASDLDDKNNENNTGHFALLPLPPALVKLNDSVARSSNGNGDLDGIPAVLDSNVKQTNGGTTVGKAESNEAQATKSSSYDEFMNKYYHKNNENKAVKTTPKTLVVTQKADATKDDKNNRLYVDGLKTTPMPTKR